jgi:hypothetical protein
VQDAGLGLVADQLEDVRDPEVLECALECHREASAFSPNRS